MTFLTAHAVNPGISRMGSGRATRRRGLSRYLSGSVLKPLQKTLERGTYSSLHTPTAPEMTGQTSLVFDQARLAEPRSVTRDVTLQHQLWFLSLQHLGLDDPFAPTRAVQQRRDDG